MTFVEQLSAGVDALVGVVSPERAARRQAARAASRFAESAYAGARSSRAWANRSTSSGSADADLDEGTLGTLRDRTRDRYRNDGFAHAAINSLADNVVGSGFQPRLRLPWKRLGITRDRAKELAVQADEVWRTWCKTADSTNRLTFDQMQHLVVASTFVSGDVFALPLMVQDARVPARYELKLELVEADRVDTPWGTERGRDIRSGVELGARGQPIAYWIHVGHPGDVGIRAAAGQRKMRRVPAHSPLGRPNVIHVFHQDRVGQSRGRPILAPVLDAFKNADDYEEAEVIAAQVSACFAAFVTKNDPWTASLARQNGESGQLEELSPGAIEYLAPGESVEFGNPTRPNSQFDAFMRAVRRRISSALGMPYEVATRDFSGTTYSQARAALLEARRMFQRRQRWLVSTLLEHVWRMLLEEAWLKGDFEAGDDFLEQLDRWTRTLWIPPGWGWIDPQKEVVAWEKALAMGVTTRSKIIAAADGGDFDDVTQELADEEDLRRDLGLAGGGAPAADDGSDDESDESPADEEGEDEEGDAEDADDSEDQETDEEDDDRS